MSNQPPCAGDAPGIDDTSNLESELSLPIMEAQKTEVEKDRDANTAINLAEGSGVPPFLSPPGDTPEDRLLNALLGNKYEMFEDILKRESVKLDHCYHREPHFGTILEIACFLEGRELHVRLLLENNADPNIYYKQPIIHHAASEGIFDILHTLLSQRNIKASVIDGKGRTALHLACLNINPERKFYYIMCIKMLIKRLELADINRQDVNGFTAFHTLLRGNQPRSIKLRSKGNDHKMRECAAEIMLEDSGGALDVDSCCAGDMTARDEVERWYPELKRLLPQRRDIYQDSTHTPLVDAMSEGRISDFEALLRQTDADGYLVFNPNHTFEEPLHGTCLELACRNVNKIEFAWALLNGGADPNLPNQITYDFPIHVTCDIGNYASLQMLLFFGANPNFSDKSGNTPLHRVVEKAESGEDGKEDWLTCFDVLLEVHNLDVNRKNDEGNTPLMIAVRYKNMSIIRKALYDEKHAWEFDIKLDDTMMNDILPELFTDEHKMDDEKQLKKRIQSTIKDGSTLPESSEVSTKLFELLYQGKEKEFVLRLREFKEKKLLPFLSIDDGNFTLLQHAVYYQRAIATRELLYQGADPNYGFSGNKSPPLVLAVCSKNIDIVKILLKNRFTRVNDTDDKGYSPLHFASRSGKLEMVIPLMSHGADLNAMNKLGKPPFDEKNAKALLDQCIHTNKKNSGEEHFVWTFDYRLLVPGIDESWSYNQCFSDGGMYVKEVSEMYFLGMLRENEKMNDLLNHPVIWSFLQFKWKRVKNLRYINLFVYIFFILSLYFFIVYSKEYPLNVNGTYFSESLKVLVPLATITMLAWILVLFRELLQLVLDCKNYWTNWDNYIDWGVLISCLLAIVLPFAMNLTPTTVNVIKYVDVITIVLSCTELLILLGRLPWFATKIKMLQVVTKSYTFLLLPYSVIIIVSALLFHLLFREEDYMNKTSNFSVSNKTETNPFKFFPMSIVKTLVMMTGELQFDTFPNNSVLSVMVFVFFVLFVSLVLLNLLTAMAVSDTQSIMGAAKRLRLQTRLDVVIQIERMVLCFLNGDYTLAKYLSLPRQLKEWLLCRLDGVVLFPNFCYYRRGRDPCYLERREGCVKPNVGSMVELSVNGDRKGPLLNREVYQSVMKILSERDSMPVGSTSLDDVNTKINVLINKVCDLHRAYQRSCREPLSKFEI